MSSSSAGTRTIRASGGGTAGIARRARWLVPDHLAPAPTWPVPTGRDVRRAPEMEGIHALKECGRLHMPALPAVQQAEEHEPFGGLGGASDLNGLDGGGDFTPPYSSRPARSGAPRSMSGKWRTSCGRTSVSPALPGARTTGRHDHNHVFVHMRRSGSSRSYRWHRLGHLTRDNGRCRFIQVAHALINRALDDEGEALIGQRKHFEIDVSQGSAKR